MNIDKMGLRSKNSRVTSLDRFVGERIRTARIAEGISQTELAVRCNTSFQQIQKYERGVNRISASRLFVIARTLDLSLAYLFQQGAVDADGQRADTEDRELLEFSRAARGIPADVRRILQELMQAIERSSSTASTEE